MSPCLENAVHDLPGVVRAQRARSYLFDFGTSSQNDRGGNVGVRIDARPACSMLRVFRERGGDMAIVLTGETAHCVYSLQQVPRGMRLHKGVGDVSVRSGAPDRHDVIRARQVLRAMGVPESKLSVLHASVRAPEHRRLLQGLICHVTSPAAHSFLLPLGHDVYVESAAVAFVHAARWMPWLELLEFGYELCGRYRLTPFGERGYEECIPMLTRWELERTVEELRGYHGAKRARRALGYVRERSRSPMETALALMIVLPRREGGMGIRSLEMDVRIPVPRELRYLTERSCYYLDLYLPRARLDIEYDGRQHGETRQRSDDDERTCVLEALGYRVRRVGSFQFFSASRMERALQGIARSAGICLGASRRERAAREQLRQGVLRNLTQEVGDEGCETGEV